MNVCVKAKMWGESSQNCENNCQCSGLITDSFRINSGNSATKRKQAEAATTNFKSRMHPHALDFKTPLSPLLSPRATPSKRRILGELQNAQNSQNLDISLTSPFKYSQSYSETTQNFESSYFKKKESLESLPFKTCQDSESYYFKKTEKESSPLTCQDSESSPFKYPQSPFRSPRSSLGDIKNSPRVLAERSSQSSFFYKSSQSSTSSYTSHRYTSEVKSQVSLSSLLRPKVSAVTEKVNLSVLGDRTDRSVSPVSSRRHVKRSSVKISRIFEERSRFKMASSSNKENVSGETFMKLDFEESSLDSQEQSLLEPTLDFKEPNLDFPEPSLDFPEPSLDFAEPSLDFEDPSTELEFKESNLESRGVLESVESSIELNGLEDRMNLNLEEETRPFGFQTERNWSATKLDFTDALHPKSPTSSESSKMEASRDFCVPDKGDDLEETDFETLHDLEEEFDNDNFDLCTKYEIISTDSPNIISRGRTSSSRKISSKNFVFGAPIGNEEQSTSFNTKSTKVNVSATRMLNFEDENFEFTSPVSKSRPGTSFSVKKSLKFNETPTKTPKSSNYDEGCSQTSDISTKPTVTPTKPKETPTKIFDRCLKFSGTPVKTLRVGVASSETLNLVTPTKPLNPSRLRHERSDSSIGSSMSSPTSSLASSQSHFRLFTSESTTSMESGFVSELEEPLLELEEHSNSPKMANFNELLSGPIKVDIFSQAKSFLKRPTLQRSLSFNPEGKGRQSLFADKSIEVEKKSQKRQEPLLLEVASKKRKADEEVRRPILQRAFSENHASIMSALTRSCTEPDLIADFSAPYALPLTPGRHDDLKAISCETLAGLINGDYDDTVGSFQVIDCRYPYEYSGGHIAAARNLYTPAQVRALLDCGAAAAAAPGTGKRTILVFHCEFSLERGPKLYRYLRSSDRSKNVENYPNLQYPEVYLLHDGYRTFYQRFPLLCSPPGYIPMLDPSHAHMLRHHRSSDQPQSFYTHHKTKGRRQL